MKKTRRAQALVSLKTNGIRTRRILIVSTQTILTRMMPALENLILILTMRTLTAIRGPLMMLLNHQDQHHTPEVSQTLRFIDIRTWYAILCMISCLFEIAFLLLSWIPRIANAHKLRLFSNFKQHSKLLVSTTRNPSTRNHQQRFVPLLIISLTV
jgi:cobalamin synthase